mmetsp:Transcript_41837/g.110309  ORF Transcript_41837/g.110309 Transcript_41837/m.110309 type:complete len:892 (-) Transcript_41837:167-2842(-)
MPGAEDQDQPLNGSGSGGGGGMSSLLMLLGGGALLACGVLLGAAGVYVLKPNPPPPVGATEDSGGISDPRSGELACGAPDSFEWQALSSIDKLAKDAVAKGLGLLQTQRKDCEGGAFPPFPFQPKDFEKGENHSHYVHVHHKYATTCSGETYKLHYFIGGGPKTKGAKSTSFIAEVHRDIGTGAWQLLRSNPAPCEISTGAAAYPETASPEEKFVKEAADFAANELGYQMKKRECLGIKDKLKVDEVKQARCQVAAGLSVELVLLISVETADGQVSDPKLTKLWVEEKCDVVARGACVKELLIPQEEGGVCSVLQSATDAAMRRLVGAEQAAHLGHVPPDATELHVAKRELLAPRRLGQSSSSSRPPIHHRHIEAGNVPMTFDPRGEDCYKHVIVYDQGSCGSCYAQSVAQMIGIRGCLVAKGEVATSRRMLRSLRRLKKHESDRRRRTVSSSSSSSRSSSSSDAIDCKDSAIWQDPYGDGCQWYSEHDAGCTNYQDEGQMTHCQETCNTCPTVVDQDSSDNPWKQAWYKYMPSVSDIADCAKTNKHVPVGCDGGNTHVIWNNWMRHLDRELWVMGADCLPYDLKCWETEPGAVVNTATGGHCANFEGYQLFHKPCSCIPHEERPSQYQCQSDAPKKSCGTSVPVAMYSIKNMAHGLSNADAVLNMQRHIHESGPIYMSFVVAQSFMSWDWSKKPVYTGGGASVGGHAVVGVGWGARGAMDYWLLRNSWGPEYDEGGYFKFRRGVNLDDIEASETAAAMMTEDYADWSAPTCDIVSWLTTWSHSSSKLLDYTMKLKVACNKAADLKIFISSKLDDRDDIYNGVSGAYQSAKMSSAGEKEVEINLLCRDFGLEAGDTWISMTATDSNKNEGKTSHFVSVPAVEGMTSASKCR